MAVQPPPREIRADFDDDTIVVYQAFSSEIAEPALASQRFVHPFSRERMTWIKPSFLWMMYRSGWATKPGQERVLAVRILRTGFESALADACLSHFDPDVYASHEVWTERMRTSAVRVQWDPERDVTLAPLPWRSLQVGLGRAVVPAYVDAWTRSIEDVTSQAQRLREQHPDDRHELPQERPYPLPTEVARLVGATSVA